MWMMENRLDSHLTPAMDRAPSPGLRPPSPIGWARAGEGETVSALFKGDVIGLSDIVAFFSEESRD